ncbi:MAG: GrpB family protein [Nannocystaceae bacterium]
MSMGNADARLGSAAAPGLAAKPILDLAVGLPEDVPFASTRALFEARGDLYRGDRGEEGGHVLVWEARPRLRTHHVYMVRLHGPQWRAYLQLRDLLRASAGARARYEQQKRRLAAQHPGDRGAYTAGKDGIVQALLAEAAALAGDRHG